MDLPLALSRIVGKQVLLIAMNREQNKDNVQITNRGFLFKNFFFKIMIPYK